MSRYRGRALRFASEFDATRRNASGFVDTYYPYTSETREIQPQTLAILESHPRVAWVKRMNTGAGKLLYPTGDASRFIRFGFPGLSDNVGQMRDGRFLAVECKLRPEVPNDDQQAFLDAVNAANGLGFWVDDPAQVWKYIPL